MTRHSRLPVALLAAGLLFLAGCTSDDTADATATEATSDAAQATETPAEAMTDDDIDGAGMLAALAIIDGAEFHIIDEAINEAAAPIEAQWLGRTRNARTAVATIRWPADLEHAAQDFVAAAGELATALEADDSAAAAGPAAATHEAQHDLSTAGWAHLAAAAGLEAAAGDAPEAGAEHEHDGAMVEAPEGLTLDVEVKPREGAIALRLTVPGLTFVTPADGRPHVGGEGHAHVTLDGADLGMYFEPEIVLTDVAPGMHEVIVTLASNTHEDYMRNGEVLSVMTMVEVP